MHELAITEAILNTALTHAKRQKAQRIHRVLLVVTELSDLQPLWIQRYFDQSAKGSIAEGAKLEVESQAPEFVCNACGAQFELSLRGIERVACTSCQSPDCTLQRGADYVVEEIEVS